MTGPSRAPRISRPRSWTIATAFVVLAGAAALAADAPGASSGTVVGASVLTATTVDVDGCPPVEPGVSDLGPLAVGVSTVTSIDCTVGFGSSNSTASLRMMQADGAGAAMFQTGPDGRADVELAGSGLVGMGTGTSAGGATAALAMSDGTSIVATQESLLRIDRDGALVQAWGRDGRADPHFGGPGSAVVDIAETPGGGVVAAGTTIAGNYAFAASRVLADGTRDPSFDVQGSRSLTPPGASSAFVDAVAVQPDGKVVLVGGSVVSGLWDATIVRLAADGSIDTTFDGDGTRYLPAYDRVYDVHAQADGKLVISGFGPAGEFVARLLADGSLDPAFSGDGIFEPATPANAASGIARQPDGKYLVRMNRWGYAAVLRLDSAGAPDPTFSGDGYAELAMGVNGQGDSLALRADGRIVLAGDYDFGGPTSPWVAGFTSTGAIDTALDGDGRRPLVNGVEVASTDGPFGVIVDGELRFAGAASSPLEPAWWGLDTGNVPDTAVGVGGMRLLPMSVGEDSFSVVDTYGSGIVAAGVTRSPAGDRTVVSRVLEDGSDDLSFGDRGTTTMPAAVQGPSGVIAGSGGQTTVGYDADCSWGVARLAADGTLDSGFGTGGISTIPLPGCSWSYASAVMRTPAGGIALVGSNTDNEFTLARFLADGTPDPSFGGDGLVSYPWVGGAGLDDGVALPDGRVVAVGWACDASDCWNVVAMFEADGDLDTTFATDGVLEVDPAPAISESLQHVLVDGPRIVLASTIQVAGGRRMHLRALTLSGAVDGSFGSGGRVDLGPLVPQGWIFGGELLRSPVDGSYTLLTNRQADTQGEYDRRVLLARVDHDGNLDTTLGPEGTLQIVLEDKGFARDATFDALHRLTVAGDDLSWGGQAIITRHIVVAGSGPTFPDHAAGTSDWTAGAGMFGACLRHLTGGATSSGTWIADSAVVIDEPAISADCADGNGDPWQAIAMTSGDPSALVASTAVTGATGQVHLRFGVRVPADQAPGAYMAPLRFQVVAPGL